jgi:hypothetical protein
MKGKPVNSNVLLSRTAASWRLAFVHAARTLHFLMRAALLSLASLGYGFTWLCCSLDRFRSRKNATAWIIFPSSSPQPAAERPCPVVLEERYQPCAPERVLCQPRAIGGLIRDRGVRA